MRSLRSRLAVLWVLALATCVAVGALLVRFYSQSAAAQVQRAEAVLARSCDMIRDRYDFYVTGWSGPPGGTALAAEREGLRAVVVVALAHQAGVEGGVWQSGAGPLAYAFPTYPGSAPKTDLPEAERQRIRAVNEQAGREGQPVLTRFPAFSQTLLLYACPLEGPLPGLTGWTMTRVVATPGYETLRAGLGGLLAVMLGMAAWLAWILASWSRHVGRLETALRQHAEGLPELRRTGERELDRIIAALNEAGRRLAEARRRSDEMAARVAASERLAALGRVAAGVAHEIRNPIAAMRLRAENALAGEPERMRAALGHVLTQVARLDGLVSQLLAMTQRRKSVPQKIDLDVFLRATADDYSDLAQAGGVRLEVKAAPLAGRFDPDLARWAVGNLVLNAIQHTPPGGLVRVSAGVDGGVLRVTVADTGPGVAPAVRETLFEPFV
ncbi:MAG: HAMP domain-containing histidine kinase, partial [Acetobacteraceae bacterium]|nr:HAMP domain-containing histidine kinase [Acetobacteraceae bacterium]